MDFYIINISDRDIHFSDIGVTVKSMTNFNLMGKKSFLTKEQILNSCLKGSIFKRLQSNLIYISLNAPKIEKRKLEIATTYLNKKIKTGVIVEDKKNKDLENLYAYEDQKQQDEQIIKEILDSEG